MSAIRLVAIDLDGTLLGDDNQVSAANRQAVQRCMERGIHVVIATMRSVRTVRPLYYDLGLTAPLICGGGARVVQSPDGENWVNHTIPLASALAIARHADEQNHVLSTLIDETAYWRQHGKQTIGEIDPYQFVVRTNVEALVAPPHRLLCYERHALAGIQQLCDTGYPDCRIEVFHKRDGAFHSLVVLSAQADKGSALKTVSERLGLVPEQVMAIGDHFNDLAMFKFAGHAVAMDNAPAKVKAHVRTIAPDHNDSGVAWALENLALES